MEPDDRSALFLPTTSRPSVADLLGGPPGPLAPSEANAAEGGATTKWARVNVACRWGSVAVVYLGLGSGLCYASFTLFFGALDDNALEQCGASAVEAESRRRWHWFISWAPGYLRTTLLVAVGCYCCKKLAGIEGAGTLQRLLVGDGDGMAAAAGWLAIVGHADGRKQSTWAQAVSTRALTCRQAVASAAAKLVFWHLSQPLAYLWLLFSYRCFVAQLGPTQMYLASIVAAREILYLVSILIALKVCPVFLLLDLRTVWEEATVRQRATRFALYILTPHNYTSLSCANRLPEWRRFFLCNAGLQVLADIASCWALANLMAGGIEQEDALLDPPCDDGGNVSGVMELSTEYAA